MKNIKVRRCPECGDWMCRSRRQCQRCDQAQEEKIYRGEFTEEDVKFLAELKIRADLEVPEKAER